MAYTHATADGTAQNGTAHVTIVYCTQCRWLLRAAWMAQELLTTFEQELGELTLRPGSGGIFEVYANDRLVWSRQQQGRFPEITELKQRVRDEIAPQRDLGHSDRARRQAQISPESQTDAGADPS